MNELDMILDIPVQIAVELGRTKITIKNLLQLAHGSVVELDAMAGEPMSVYVNGTLIAQGEVVVVNDKFGIRLTDIVTPSERARRFGRCASLLPPQAIALADGRLRFATLEMCIRDRLGTVEITLKIDKDSANAHFVSANAEVRGAIETALPRLREMFASAGIDLGQVSVGGESFRQQSDGQRQPAGSPRPMADTAILGNDSRGDLVGQSIVTHRGSALVDIFA